MKTEIKTPIIVVAAIAIIAVIGYFGMKMVNDSGSLDHGQIKYTPGVPPWLEKDASKKGPGTGAPAAPGGGPAGVGAPVIGTGGK
ncbi:MAG: hypothetical protein P4L46_11705 [Fimbriimonas sp.]|nr:hypothetical protein [Fimbriimonas sp.]